MMVATHNFLIEWNCMYLPSHIKFYSARARTHTHTHAVTSNEIRERLRFPTHLPESQIFYTRTRSYKEVLLSKDRNKRNVESVKDSSSATKVQVP